MPLDLADLPAADIVADRHAQGLVRWFGTDERACCIPTDHDTQ